MHAFRPKTGFFDLFRSKRQATRSVEGFLLKIHRNAHGRVMVKCFVRIIYLSALQEPLLPSLDTDL